MSLKSAKEKLLSFAIKLNPEIQGVGATPPTIIPPYPAGNILLPPPKSPTSRGGVPADGIQNIAFQNLRMEPNRVVPYATGHVFNHEMEAIQDLLRARKMEEQLDSLLLKSLYEISEVGESPEIIAEALSSVEGEIEAVSSLLSALESLVLSMDQAETVFEKTERQKRVISKISEFSEAIGLDPITSSEDEEPYSLSGFLSDITSLSVASLENMTITGIFIQVLKDMDFCLEFGISMPFGVPVGSRDDDPFQDQRGYSEPKKSYRQYAGPTPKALSSIGPGNSQYDYVYGGKVGQPNKQTQRINIVATNKIPRPGNITGIDLIAYYSTILSREFLFSGGLGSIQGSPLAQTFGGSDGFSSRKSLLGIKDLKSLITGKDAQPNSLADFAVVNSDGTLQATAVSAGLPDERVFLLEGGEIETPNCFSAKEKWLDTLKTDPLNNKVNIHTNVLKNATSRFQQAEDFITAITGRGSERVLLSPKGLFSRILRDFSIMLEGLTAEGDSGLRARRAGELMLMANSVREGSPVVGDRQEVRRQLNIYIARYIALHRQANESLDMSTQLRLSSRETEPGFTAQITAMQAGSAMLAKSMGQIQVTARGQKTQHGNYVMITGNDLKDYLADIEISDSVPAMIAAIFNDLHNEAMELARSEDDNQTYLRPANTTLWSGLDGAMVIAMIYECFAVLANTVLDINMELSTSAKNAHKIFASFGPLSPNTQEKNVALVTAIAQYSMGKHLIRWRTFDLENTRRVFLEVANSLDNNDLSNLINADGKIPTAGSIDTSKDVAKGPSANMTPSEIIDVAEMISREDDIPIQLFLVGKSIIHNMLETTQDISDRARALAGDTTDVPDDIAVLQTLGTTELGRKFIQGLSRTQIKYANKRLQSFKSVEELPYSIGSVPNEIFESIEFLIEDKKGEFTHSAVMFLGIPTQLIENVSLGRELSIEESELIFTIDKVDELVAVDYNPINKKFGLRYNLTEEAIVEAYAEEAPPKSLTDLISLVKFDVAGEDEPIQGKEIIALSNNPTATGEHLRNEVESYLLKKMFEIIQNIALFEEKIQFGELQERSITSKSLMSNLIQPLNLDETVPDVFFGAQSNKNFVKIPDAHQLSSLIQPQKLIVSGISGWRAPVMTSDQVDTLYSLFSTKPFYVNKIREVVMSRSIFDNLFAVMIDLDEFEVNMAGSVNFIKNYFKRQDTPNLSGANIHKLLKELKSPDRFNVESLYVSADLESV